MKTLSIVVPSYNVEKYIDRCLISMLDEELLNDIEIIIVNDGSKDNTVNIAKSYQQAYPNTIVVIDKENGGHGSAINAGVKVATGKYCKVLDSDDWFNIDDFKNFVYDLKKLDVDLVVTNYTRELVYSGESILFKYKNMEYNKIYNFDKFDFSKLDLDYFFMATSTFKTEILKNNDVRLDEKMFYVDMEFVIFPIKYINSFIYLNYDIYRYFIGRADQSVSSASMVKNRKNHETVLRKLITYYEEEDLSETKKKYIFNILKQMLNTHYIIYCSYKTMDKNQKNEIREFDNFLKTKSPDLYAVCNERAYIRWNRRTKFKFASTKRQLFTRLVNAYEIKYLYRKKSK